MGHNYVNGQKNNSKPHNTPAEEIRAAFIQAGWVGELKKRRSFMRIVPFFDRGPGL